jgi:hypothetical protein
MNLQEIRDKAESLRDHLLIDAVVQSVTDPERQQAYQRGLLDGWEAITNQINALDQHFQQYDGVARIMEAARTEVARLKERV